MNDSNYTEMVMIPKDLLKRMSLNDFSAATHADAEALRSVLASQNNKIVTEPVAWQFRRVDPDEGFGDWQVLNHKPHMEILAENGCYEIVPLYTKPGSLDVQTTHEKESINGCCCPPVGFKGTWAAAMCPVHYGLRAMVDKVKSYDKTQKPLILPTADDLHDWCDKVGYTGSRDMAHFIWNAYRDKLGELN